MNIKASRPVPVSVAKEILAKRKEEGELGYEQNQALENAERFAPADSKKAKSVLEAIEGIGKMTPELAAKIADIHPANAATLRAILVKDRVELSEEEAAAVLKELA